MKIHNIFYSHLLQKVIIHQMIKKVIRLYIQNIIKKQKTGKQKIYMIMKITLVNFNIESNSLT